MPGSSCKILEVSPWMGDHSSVEVDAVVIKYSKNLRSGEMEPPNMYIQHEANKKNVKKKEICLFKLNHFPTTQEFEKLSLFFAKIPKVVFLGKLVSQNFP